MTRFISGAIVGGVIGYGVWHFEYPGIPNGWLWVVAGAIAFGVLYAWFGHRLLEALLDWLWFRS
ncbi:MAG TPA: hypothetical protein VF614_13160 [Chthoniobacteraceae bacterium]|jgi:uncharacterized membrane protein YccC